MAISATLFDSDQNVPYLSPRVQEIDLRNLVIDQRYQREISGLQVRRIVDNFNPKLLSYLVVSDRNDGTYAILDGQHRVAAMRSMGMRCAPCYVHSGITERQEAEIFDGVNRFRRQTTSKDHFRARIFMKDPDALAIQSIAAECGVILASHSPSGNSNSSATIAYKAINYVYEVWGPDILRNTFYFARQAWPNSYEALVSCMIYGIGRFLKTYGAEIKIKKATEKLSTVHPNTIKADANKITPIGTARGSSMEGGIHVARVIVSHYNKGRAEDSRLDELQLFVGQAIKKDPSE